MPEAAELFGDTVVRFETEIVEETAEQSIALLRTTSTYFRIDEGRRPSFEADVSRLFDRIGGTARFERLAVLALTRRLRG